MGRNSHWGKATRGETSWGETSWGQKEISGRNCLGRNDSDFRRQDSNVFYPLQNQFKANALIDRRRISQTLICDYSNCRISSMYLGIGPRNSEINLVNMNDINTSRGIDEPAWL